MPRSLLLFLLSLVTITCQAQYIRWSNSNSFPQCTNIPVSFLAAGPFTGQNEFKVQVRQGNTGDVFLEIPVKVANGIGTFLPPESLSDGNYYQMRAASTSPAVATDWISLLVSRLPKVRLESVFPNQVNPGQPVSLKTISTFSNRRPIVVLSDSSVIEINGYSKPYNDNITLPAPRQTMNWSVLSATNECGTQYGGENTLKIEVNPVPVRVISAFPATVCPGSDVHVVLSVPEGIKLGSGSSFSILLCSANPLSATPEELARAQRYELPAELSGNRLKAKIPASVSEGAYYLQAGASNPKIASDVFQQKLEVRRAAKAQVTQPDATIRIGESIDVGASVSGPGPYFIKWSNGVSESSAGSLMRPTQTTTFRIDQFRSGCEESEIIPSSTTVTVLPGIRIDSIPSQIFCPGTEVRLPVTSTVTAASGTEYWVDFQTNGPGQAPVMAGSVKAVLAGGLLSFRTPDLPGVRYQSRVYYLSARTTSPATSGYPHFLQPFRLNGFPQPSLGDPMTLDRPGSILIPATDLGGGPTDIRLSNGRILHLSAENATRQDVRYYVDQTENLTIESARNLCGVVRSPSTPSMAITVRQPSSASIRIDSVQQNRCLSDSVLVWFTVSGDVSGNVVSVYSDILWGDETSGAFTTFVASGKSSPIAIRLPENRRIRLSAAGKVSNVAEVLFKGRLSSSLSAVSNIAYAGNAAEGEGIPSGEPLQLMVNLYGQTNYFSFVLTDGTRDYTYSGARTPAGGMVLSVLPPSDRSTTYRLKSVSNECGPGQAGETSVTVTPMPFRILIPGISQKEFPPVCAGSPLSVPFQTHPAAPKGTQFVLELARTQDLVFREIGATATSPFVVDLADNLATGTYLLRIRDKNSTARTIHLPVSVSARAKAQLSLVSPADGVLTTQEYGQFRVDVDRPSLVRFSDNLSGYVSPPGERFERRFRKGPSFGIADVTNECGYGLYNQALPIRIKPDLKLTSVSNTFVCRGSDVDFAIDASGDFSPNVRVTFGLRNTKGVVTEIGDSPVFSGTYRHRIPATLPSGPYTLEVKAPGTETIIQEFTLLENADVRITGTTSIIKGRTAQLRVIPDFPAGVATVLLSDGGQLPAVTPSAWQTYPVSPSQTTTYTIHSSLGECGLGKTSGSAVVSVRESAPKTVVTEDLRISSYCDRDTLSVPFTAFGSFSSGNAFQVHLSDATGSNFRPIGTNGVSSPLSAPLPAGLPPGNGYRVMVVPTDQGAATGASSTIVQIQGKPYAAYDTTFYHLLPDRSVFLGLTLSGDGPWDISADHAGKATSYVFWPGSKPVVRRFDAPTGLYRITGVRNACYTGEVLTPGQTLVEDIVLSVTPENTVIRVGPNPTDGPLRIQTGRPGLHTFVVTDQTGREYLKQQSADQVTVLYLNSLPSGLYILSVSSDEGKRFTYRISRR